MQKRIPFDKIQVGKRYKTRHGFIYICTRKDHSNAYMERTPVEFAMQTEKEKQFILRMRGTKSSNDTCTRNRQDGLEFMPEEWALILEVGAKKKLGELKPVRARKMSLVRIG